MSNRSLGAERLVELLENGENEEIRGDVFLLPQKSSRAEQPLLKHQVQTLAQFASNNGHSGIIHLPTGAGKTRVGVQIAAERLTNDHEERVIWATYSLGLIRQGMLRLVELASLFPAKTKFQWITSGNNDADLLRRAHITFCSRGDLKRLLDRAADGRVTEAPLGFLLEADEHARVTLIYDECHELGAAKLQSKWRKLERTRVARKLPEWHDRFQTIGLSATPLPTNVVAHRFLQSTIFPPSGGKTVKKEWGMLVHASIDNETLIRDKILCRINLTIQDTRVFDLPQDIVRRAAGGRLKAPVRPTKQDLNEFSQTFNRTVMSDDNVLQFLAKRLGENLDTLGKTLVFVPTIDAANRLAQHLKACLAPGKVSVVHSRLDELKEDGDEQAQAEEEEDRSFADVQRQISAFKKRGSEPCIMVNVGMLTTGFDDPKIKTVVLGRLTFSTNLFWQMIGRGTRGLQCGGTRYCNVIDPIRLTDKFNVMQGYRPQLEGDVPYATLDQRDMGDDALDPRVKTVREAPEVRPGISPLLRADVAAALRSFLKSGRLDASLLAKVAVQTTESNGVLNVEYVPNSPKARKDPSVDQTGVTFFALQIERLALDLRSLGQAFDLTWLEAHIPATTAEHHVEDFNETIDFVRRKKTYTEVEFRRAHAQALRAT